MGPGKSPRLLQKGISRQAEEGGVTKTSQQTEGPHASDADQCERSPKKGARAVEAGQDREREAG